MAARRLIATIAALLLSGGLFLYLSQSNEAGQFPIPEGAVLDKAPIESIELPDEPGDSYVVDWEPSDSVTLYRDCRNYIQAIHQAKAADFNPRFRIEGGTLIDEPGLGDLSVFPGGATVTVTALQNDQVLGQKTWHAVLPPEPEVTFSISGATLVEGQTIRIQTLSDLNARVIPNPEFAQSHPEDARYRVSQWQATLTRADQVVGSETTLRGQELGPIAKLIKQAKPGDRFTLEVIQVQRLNAQHIVKIVETSAVPIQVTLQ